MRHYLGIDAGASKIMGIIWNGRKIVRSAKIGTPKNRKKFLDALGKMAEFLAEKKKIYGIGVGVPGIADPRNGVLLKAPNLPFLDGWNAKKFFRKFAVPVKVDNDSRCMLRAEAAFGAGRKRKNIVALAIGTGVGGGLIIDGKIYCGGRNGAGEFGHTIMDYRSSATFENLAGKKAFQKYGDRSRIVGLGAANLINAFDPDIIILGGGGITGGAVKISKVKQEARKHIMSDLGRKTPIVKGKLGENAQAIGSVLLFQRSGLTRV